jgi:flagellar P-ring protein precursor FlgI
MSRHLLALAFLPLLALPAVAQVRIKDVTDVAGARGNYLVGFGLVVGLDNTGSRSSFTQQVAVDMMQRLGVTSQIFSPLPSESTLRATNISAVMVTAEIGPFVRKGATIDVTVSSMDDARSLQGGKLIMTPLKGADGQVYAVAQGPLSVGGFSVSGQAAGLQKNQLNTGRIPNGAMIEKEAPGDVVQHDGRVRFLLKDADFNSARLIAKAINARFPKTAHACDPGAVEFCPPLDAGKCPADLVAEVGLLEFKPDTTAKVIINERTGTVVAGEHVTIGTVAITHGNLFISTAETPFAVQPAPFSGGQTAVLPRTQVSAAEQRSRMVVLPKAASVADVARALNALGVTPRDLISIFQMLKKVGALHAELTIV